MHPQRIISACSIEGCESPALARGWCDMHYRRWRRTGDPLSTLRGSKVRSILVCSVDGCEKRASRRGWCSAHYERWRLHGDPIATHQPRIAISPVERFWSHVDKNGPIPEHRPELGNCWIWTGARLANGYGVITVAGKSLKAHRFSYEHFVGPIPDDLVPDHLCRNHPCVNYDHLEPVTTRENLLRGIGFAATNSSKTHCPYGHPYSGDNLHVMANRRRVCRACKREKTRRWRAAQKEMGGVT